jgi:hypothetical protein
MNCPPPVVAPMCIPASDFALALKVGQTFQGAEMKVAGSLGVPEKRSTSCAMRLCCTL